MPNFSIRIAATPPLRTSSVPPATPGMMNPPSVTPVGPDALLVGRAAAPAHNGAPIDRYDLRHSTDEVTWTEVLGIADPETLTGLAASTLVFVQTRAVNGIGPGPWSLSNAAFTSAAPAAPDAFAAEDWSLADAGNGGGLTINVLGLPGDGGSPITGLEYQVNGGGWIPLGGAGVGIYQIFVLGLSGPVDIAIRAVNALGGGGASDTKSATPTFAPPSLSGITLPQQNLARGVAVTPINVSSVFNGSFSSITVAASSPDPLPEGLVLAPSGQITGTPTEATLVAEPPVVHFEATGASGSASYTQGVVFTVSGPNLEALTVTGNTVSLSSDTGGGVMHLWFGSDPNPEDADIINGTGTGFLAERDFTVSGAGGATTNWDLSAFQGINGYLFALQIAPSGAYSNRFFIELTPQVADSVPAAFGAADWTLADKQTGGTAAVTVNTLPANGGSALTAFEYQLDGGAWTVLTASPAAGVFDITGLTDGVPATVAIRAVNAVGGAPASDVKAVTTTLDLPALSGSTLPQQNLFRGVAITPIDTSVLFTGNAPAIDIDPQSSETLPLGLSIDAAGLITGTPIEATSPSDLPNVQFRATGAAGSVTYTQGVVFTVSGPNLEALTVTGNTVSLSSDTGGGVMHLWFGSDPNPEDADIINGTGTGFLAERDFTVSGAGGATTNWDLSAFQGINGYLFALQIAPSGAYSNRFFIELTPQVADSVPAAFGAADWTLADKQTGGTAAVTVNTLPANGGSALTAFEYQLDGGAWAVLTASPAAGVFDITGLTDGVPATVAIRAVNAVGGAPASDVKAVTTTGVPSIVLSNYSQDVAVDPVAISFSASSSAAGADVYVEIHDTEGSYPGRGFGAFGSHMIGTLSGGSNVELETGFLVPYAGLDIVLYVTVGPEWASNALGGTLFTAPTISAALLDPDGTPWVDPDGTPLGQ